MTDLERQKRLNRLDKLATALDSKFTLPGTGLKFGWDGIFGLIPGLGDLVTLAPAVWMFSEAYKMGARKRTLFQMAINTGLDLTVGAIPVFGDIFDFAFKANKKNIALLKKEINQNTSNSL